MKVSFYTPDGPYPGRIVQTVEGEFSRVIAPTAAARGLPYVLGAYGQDHYVHNGAPQRRPACPATLEGNVLQNVPPASTLTINRKSYPCPDGVDVELEFDQPGKYRIRVTGWPYLDGEFDYENPPL